MMVFNILGKFLWERDNGLESAGRKVNIAGLCRRLGPDNEAIDVKLSRDCFETSFEQYQITSN